MENRKRSSVMTVLSVLLCISFAIGITYAFFTDSAKSSGNNIQTSGLLVDLELLNKNGTWDSIKEYNLRFDQEMNEWYDQNWECDDNGDPIVPPPQKVGIFNNQQWEPGYTDVKIMRVVNQGDLALEWRANMWLVSGFSDIANVIDVYIKTDDAAFGYPTQRDEIFGENSTWTNVGTLAEFFDNASEKLYGTLQAPTEDQPQYAYFGIALHMREEAGNEYQGLGIQNFNFIIEAIQVQHEEDAIGTDYDQGAHFPTSVENLVFTPYVDESTDEVIGYSVTSIDTITRQNIVIPSTYDDGVNGELPVIRIAAWAFEGKNLKSVVIPDTVTHIESGAFTYCRPLREIVIPDSVTYLGSEVFAGCNSLVSVTLPDHLERIGDYTFYSCSSLTVFDFPTGLASIGEEAFACSGLEEITLPDGITYIGDKAFWRCQNLKKVTIPQSIVYMGEDAFGECTSLSTVNFEDGVQTLGYSSFMGCSALKEITVPGSIAVVESYCFSGCSNLETLILCEGTVSLDYYAFYDCPGPFKVTIPTSLTAISNYNFSSIEPIYITYLGTRAQWDAANLSKQLLPNYYSSGTYHILFSDGTTTTLRGYQHNY